MPDDAIFTPMIQGGFAVFSAVLLGVVVWLTRKLLDAVEKSNKVIAENTAAIRDVHVMARDNMKLTRTVHELMIARPCLTER